MAAQILPILELEDVVQVLDKTRLDASKSFVATGEAITAMTIKPTIDSSAISVLANLRLDWAYIAGGDFSTTSFKLFLQEAGVNAREVTVFAAQGYTLAQIATTLAAQLSADQGHTFAVEHDEETGKFRITSDGPTFRIFVGDPDAEDDEHELARMLGFTETTEYALEHESETEVYFKRKVTLSVTADAVTTEISAWIKVVTEPQDHLFSTDAELRTHEPNLMDYLVSGRATFKDKHRLAQREMLRWLDKEGYTDAFLKRFTKASLPDIEEVTDWAKFTALRLIFAGIHNATDDVFREKSKEYKGMEVAARERAMLRIDIDGDGETSVQEAISPRDCIVVRR